MEPLLSHRSVSDCHYSQPPCHQGILRPTSVFHASVGQLCNHCLLTPEPEEGRQNECSRPLNSSLWGGVSGDGWQMGAGPEAQGIVGIHLCCLVPIGVSQLMRSLSSGPHHPVLLPVPVLHCSALQVAVVQQHLVRPQCWSPTAGMTFSAILPSCWSCWSPGTGLSQNSCAGILLSTSTPSSPSWEALVHHQDRSQLPSGQGTETRFQRH